MQEIVLLLSSLAGIATAAAVRATATTHRGGSKVLTLGASSQIQSQIKTLRMEKQILARTITRLYQSEELDIPRERKERMLARYQHQMGIVMARLEKLEDAKRHPDLGPVGDGLITLMDQKLSGLDGKMQDITMAVADIKAGQQQQQRTESKDTPADAAALQGAKAADAAVASAAEAAVEKGAAFGTGAAIPRNVRPFEITTLTSIPTRKPRFPTLEEGSRTEKKTEAGSEGMAAATAKTETATIPAPASRRKDASIIPETSEIRPSITPPPAPQPDVVKPAREGAPGPVLQEPKPPERERRKQETHTPEAPAPAEEQGSIDTVPESGIPATGQIPPAGMAEPKVGDTVHPKKDDEAGKRGAGDKDEDEDEDEDEAEMRRIVKDIAKTLEKLDKAESE